MKTMFRAFCALLSISVLFVSCLGDDEDTVTYSDTTITAVTLGTLNRYTSSKSSKTGNDTIIKSTLTGSTYPITIDQLGCKIFNQKPFPVGTDLEHVVISALATKNSGVPFIKSLISDSLFYYSSTDSLDFSQPRMLRVYSSDGTAFRDYTMTLTASDTAGITFEWQKVAEREELKGWNDKHLVAFADTVVLVDNGTIGVNSSLMGRPALMCLDAEGKLWSTRDLDNIDDPTTWQEKTHVGSVSRLIGATEHEMYALGTDGRLKVSIFGMVEDHQGIKEGDGYVVIDTDGFSWRDEQLDDDTSLLPASSIAMTSWAYTPADSTDYVLMAGNNDADGSNAVLWRKLSHYRNLNISGYEDTEGTWVYMPVDGSNRYTLPRMEGLSLVYYNKSVLAVGSNKQMLQSRDQGITWKPVSAYALPSDLQGILLTMAADTKGRLWIVTDAGQVWQGALR